MSILIGHEGPGCEPSYVMQPTDRSLADLIEYWNSGSAAERTAVAAVALGDKTPAP